MGKFLNSLKFIGKALLLLLLLIFGWVFVNVQNLTKGKKSGGEKDSGDLWGVNQADADAPGGGPGPGFGSCPHVAYFDGQQFQVENNFLLGKPQSFSDYAAIRALHEQKLISPDLMKFTSTPLPYNNWLTLKLHEIEDKEETFVSWLKLIHIFHSKDSEIIIDSGFEKLYVVDKDATEKEIVLPSEARINSSRDLTWRFNKKELLWEDHSRDPNDRSFDQRDSIEFIFHLPMGSEAPYLVFKSMLRGPLTMTRAGARAGFTWLKFVNEPALSRALTLLLAALYLAFEHKSLGDALAFVPFVFGTQSQSIRFSYLDKVGRYRQFLIHEPRDWRYGTEVTRLPKEAVRQDGSLKVRAEFTQRHKLNFIGILPDVKELGYREEVLPVKKAIHSRDGDITEAFSEESSNYAHMISGDEITMEFKNPELGAEESEKETYLMQSSGFYTVLRDELKGRVENWQERISPEAKRYTKEMADLRR